MYDVAELRPDHDALWQAIAAELRVRGIDAPPALTRHVEPAALWRDPELLMSQTCGWPFVTELAPMLTVVGAFEYAVDSDAGTRYRSQLITAAGSGRSVDDLGRPGVSIAVNAADSLSGWVSLRGLLDSTDGRWEGAVVATGAHVRSIEAVAHGVADVALVDEVTLALLHTHRPEAVRGIEVVGVGPQIPGLPLVVRRDGGAGLVPTVRAAIGAAIERPDLASTLRRLLIRRFHPVDDEHCAPLRQLCPPTT